MNKKKELWKALLLSAIIFAPLQANAQDIEATLLLKQPGNRAVAHQLHLNNGRYEAKGTHLPLQISQTVTADGDDKIVTINLKADADVYFNFGAQLATGLSTEGSEFYMPGFWYHRNLRSPKEAPSFATSTSWNFRDDRLSTPLTSVYNTTTGSGWSVLRVEKGSADVQTQHTKGEIILQGNTTIGYLGFDNETGKTKLTFGYPYVESPRRYIRKLTLAPSVTSFVKMQAGESKTLTWRIHETKAASYGDFVAHTWQYCFDQIQPQPLKQQPTANEVKAQLCNYFRESYVSDYPLKYNSGMTIFTYDCKPSREVQIGFCGRVLLNAFNEVEWGEANNDKQLVEMGHSIIESFMQNGFTDAGYLIDFVNFNHGMPQSKDVIHSIRQQSEAVYAMLHYLKYERQHGRQHKEWEKKMRTVLDNFLTLQKADGSFARKYNDAGADIDASGGSTPSATSTLVMGWKYFGDKRYLAAAKRTV